MKLFFSDWSKGKKIAAGVILFAIAAVSTGVAVYYEYFYYENQPIIESTQNYSFPTILTYQREVDIVDGVNVTVTLSSRTRYDTDTEEYFTDVIFLSDEVKRLRKRKERHLTSREANDLDLIYISETEITILTSYNEIGEMVNSGEVNRFHLENGASGNYSFPVASSSMKGIAFGSTVDESLFGYSCFVGLDCVGSEIQPSGMPSMLPSVSPTVTPSAVPTRTSSLLPTLLPTISIGPSLVPSPHPTKAPSDLPPVPTASPTASPSIRGSMNPTQLPTSKPTAEPSPAPTSVPSPSPTDFNGIPSPVLFASSEPESSYTTSGTINFWQRYTLDIFTGQVVSKITIEFLDIKPPSAPGAKLYLTPSESGKKIDGEGTIILNIEGTEDGLYTKSGNYEQEAPANFNVNDLTYYRRIIIWCEPFDVYIGEGDIVYT